METHPLATPFGPTPIPLGVAECIPRTLQRAGGRTHARSAHFLSSGKCAVCRHPACHMFSMGFLNGTSLNQYHRLPSAPLSDPCHAQHGTPVHEKLATAGNLRFPPVPMPFSRNVQKVHERAPFNGSRGMFLPGKDCNVMKDMAVSGFGFRLGIRLPPLSMTGAWVQRGTKIG